MIVILKYFIWYWKCDNVLKTWTFVLFWFQYTLEGWMGRCLFWLLQVILFWVFCPFAYSIFRLIIMKPALVKVVPNNLALPNGGMLVIKSFLVKFFHSKNIFLMFCCWRWGLRFIYFAPVVIMAVFWLVFVCFFIKTKNICFHH